MSKRYLTALSLLLASFAAIPACSSDPDEAAAVSSTTTRISAKDGGKVEDPSGKATLTIPPGALAEDTDISLSVFSATNDTVTAIYDFGPDGLAFLEPATLEINVDAATIGDKSVAVALETDGQFVALSGSSYANGVASAKVEHFSKFTVVFIDGKAQRTSCDDAVENFVACGGDIEGTWIFEDVCFANVNDQPNASCPEFEMSIEHILDGVEWTFRSDGTWSRSTGMQTTIRGYTVPLSCAPGTTSCKDVEKDSHTCEGSTICTCTQQKTFEWEGDEGVYRVEGNGLVASKAGEGDPDDYCIEGDRLFVRSQRNNGETTFIRLTRK